MRRNRHGVARPPSWEVEIVALGAFVTMAVLVALLIVTRDGTERPARLVVPSPAAPAVLPPAPTPVPVRPSPSPSSPSPSTSSPSPTPSRVASPSRSAERPALRPGAEAGLTVAGLRVRHRDFRIEVSAVGPASSPTDRADATFAVRRGLADDDCVSLEAVNFPGRFVRHRDFRLLLDPRADTALFRADATFCPEDARGGRIVLRSVNYPDRFVVVDGSDVVLRPGTPTRFEVRPGL